MMAVICILRISRLKTLRQEALPKVKGRKVVGGAMEVDVRVTRVNVTTVVAGVTKGIVGLTKGVVEVKKVAMEV